MNFINLIKILIYLIATPTGTIVSHKPPRQLTANSEQQHTVLMDPLPVLLLLIFFWLGELILRIPRQETRVTKCKLSLA